MGLTRHLYRAARLSNDLGALASRDPGRIANRAKNKAVGRGAARLGLWRRLWGRWL
jgi:hypothetical protein